MYRIAIDVYIVSERECKWVTKRARRMDGAPEREGRVSPS